MQQGLIIDKKFLENGIVSEFEPHKFVAEASSLGLRPGEWPTLIGTTLGNGRNFVRARSEERDGDLLWVVYLQTFGCIELKIFND